MFSDFFFGHWKRSPPPKFFWACLSNFIIVLYPNLRIIVGEISRFVSILLNPFRCKYRRWPLCFLSTSFAIIIAIGIDNNRIVNFDIENMKSPGWGTPLRGLSFRIFPYSYFIENLCSAYRVFKDYKSKSIRRGQWSEWNFAVCNNFPNGKSFSKNAACTSGSNIIMII